MSDAEGQAMIDRHFNEVPESDFLDMRPLLPILLVSLGLWAVLVVVGVFVYQAWFA
jgi:hypothetical protein